MARQQEEPFSSVASRSNTMNQDNSESSRSSSQSKRSYDFMSKFSVDMPTKFVPPVRPEQRDAIPLPSSYQVSDLDVVCGRGRAHVNRPGNQRFRKIVEKHAEAYEQAASKIAKTSVLCNIVEEVMAGNKIVPGRFVKEVDGQWFELPPVTAREKAGHAIRDVLVLQQAAKDGRPAKRQARSMSDEMKTTSLNKRQSTFDNMMNKSWPAFGMNSNTNMELSLSNSIQRGFESAPNLFVNEDLALFSNEAFPQEQPSAAFNESDLLSPTPLAPNSRLEPSFQHGSNAMLFASKQLSSSEERPQVDQAPAPYAATSSTHFGGNDLRSLFAANRGTSDESSRQLHSQSFRAATNKEHQNTNEDEDELFGRTFFSLSDRNRN